MKSNKVLVLHQSSELQLITLQNRLCEEQKTSGIKMLKLYPLWSDFLPEETDKKSVTGIKILAPQKKDNYIVCPVEIYIDSSSNEQINTEIKILMTSGFVQLPEEFVLEPRVFRFARKHSNGNRYWLTESEWVKLKK